MRSTPRFARLLGRWAGLLSLAMCLSIGPSLTGCATPGPTTRPVEPPPAGLSAPCSAGPAYPQAASAPLSAVLDVVAAREAAAADCRARHAALVSAWPR